MKTQISSFPNVEPRAYSGVYQQQGRMLTDADWNELVETLKARLVEALATVIGSGAPSEGGFLEFPNPLPPLDSSGVPLDALRIRDGGMAIVDGITARVNYGWSVTLTPGASESSRVILRANNVAEPETLAGATLGTHLYEFEARRLVGDVAAIDGPEAVAAFTAFEGPHGSEGSSIREFYRHQAAFPLPPPLFISTAEDPPHDFLFYLDVWERTVTALQDPGLADPALHGADTTSRTQVVAQLKCARLPSPPEEPESVILNPDLNPPRGMFRLKAAVLPPTAARADGGCVPEVSLDARTENFLLRIEIHSFDVVSERERKLVVKWSSENAAEAYGVQYAAQAFGPDRSSVFEFFNEYTEKHMGVHLPEDKSWRPWHGKLEIGWPATIENGYPFVRRWDGMATVVVTHAETGVGWKVDEDGTLGSVQLVDPDGEGLIRTLHITVRGVQCELALWNADRLAHAAVPGDYWLVRVRADATASERVQLASELPLGIVHHYLPLVRVNGLATESLNPSDSDRARHFRRLRFPHFSQLNLEDVQAMATLIDQLGVNLNSIRDQLTTEVNARVRKAGDVLSGPLTIDTSRQTAPTEPLILHGPHSPDDGRRLNYQDLVLKFAAAGSAKIRSHRGGSWDTYLEFLTNGIQHDADRPEVRLHIDYLGNAYLGSWGTGPRIPHARLSVVAPGAEQTDGIGFSKTFRTSSGALPSDAGAELALANFGFHSTHTSSLSVRARRTRDGEDWLSTAIGLSMHVDTDTQAGANLWLHSDGRVAIGKPTHNSASLSLEGANAQIEIGAGVPGNQPGRLRNLGDRMQIVGAGAPGAQSIEFAAENLAFNGNLRVSGLTVGRWRFVARDNALMIWCDNDLVARFSTAVDRFTVTAGDGDPFNAGWNFYVRRDHTYGVDEYELG